MKTQSAWYIKQKMDCEPTYEELKPIWHAIVLMLNSGLRAYLWGIETAFHCADVPVEEQLRAYLWGIETVTGEILSSSRYILRAYLWGIETLFGKEERSRQLDCEPTYEELKLKMVTIKFPDDE